MQRKRRRWLWCFAVLVIALGYALVPRNRLPEGAMADKIVVSKSARTLTLYERSIVLKTYHVSLGSQPEGAKQFEGDGRTPEGSYTIDSRNPNSSCYRALRISYPSVSDAAHAEAVGKRPGGDIMIHGLRNGLGWLGRWHRLWDWTAGCVAVTNAEIDELWRAVTTGTPIEILP